MFPLKTLLERKLHPHEYLGGGNGLATTTQIIKQADVVLMTVSLRRTIFARNQIRQLGILRTPHRTWLQPERLLLFTHRRPNRQSGLGIQILYENRHHRPDRRRQTICRHRFTSAAPIRPATAAHGCRRSLACVVSIAQHDGISVNPHLPAHWTKVKLSILFHGQKLRITLAHKSVVIEAVDLRAISLPISVNGQNYLLPQTGTITIPISQCN